MTDRTDAAGRISGLMMLAAGIDPRDVARLLGVRPEQIKRWMAQPHQPEEPGNEAD